MSLNKGSLGIAEVYKGSLPIAEVYKGNDLIWQNVVSDIEFKIIEDGTDGSQITDWSLHSVTYEGNIANYNPITYDSNGVCDMGSWQQWVENHFTPVMLKNDGTEDYELSRTNQNYKADGVTQSDIANINYNGNAMLRIKKFYLYCTTELVGTGGTQHREHTIRISDRKKNSNYTCWGFVDKNGVEHDYAYYGLFMGHVDSNNKLRSMSGVTLSASNHHKTYSDIIAAAQANGNGFSISNTALENAIGLVILMLFKSVNPIFIQRDENFGTENESNYVVTGSRANTGGFPACLNATDALKALWIEGYWRSYASYIGFAQWLEGFGSLKDSSAVNNGVSVCYRLKAPYDLNDIDSWIKSNVPFYYWSTNSHQPQHLMFEDNLLLPYDVGLPWGGTSATKERARSRCYGGGDLNGTAQSNHSTSAIMPGKKGGVIYRSDMLPPHFVSYGLYGNTTGDQYQKATGRLTYLPQPANS